MQISSHLNEPVTQHMRSDFIRLHAGQTIAEALAAIRDQTSAGRIIYFYVLDEQDRLQGVVPTRRLLLGSPEQSIAEIMVDRVTAIPAGATVLEACEFFTIHRLLAFPIVDQGRMVGVVDVDLYTQGLDNVEQSERSGELFQLVGVHLAASQQASSLASFRARFPWLLCNLGGGIVAAFLAGMFEAELARVVSLALFIPVVLALAESVSIQSVSLALQMLHGGSPSLSSLAAGIPRESLTGALLGVAAGAVVAGVTLVWLQQGRLALCIGLAVSGGMLVAAVVGMTLPNLLRLLKLDPRFAAGPMALAAADMLTLLLYFNLARWLL
jgi:magnesium transporter